MSTSHAVDVREPTPAPKPQGTGAGGSAGGQPFSEQLADTLGGPAWRGMRNALRSPVRLVLVAAILGVSLMFVGVMVALNASVQQRVSAAQAQIGTGITISPADGGFGGGSGATSYLTASQVATVEKTAGVTSLSEYLTTRDSDGVIKGTVQIPANLPTFGGAGGNNGASGTGGGGFFGRNSVDGTIAPTIQGLLPGQNPLTLANGVSATLKAGRNLTTADANASVALTSQALATANGYKLGSTITLNGAKVTLVGFYSASDSFDNDTIVVPLQTAQRIYDITGVTGLTAYASSVSQVNTVTSALQKALGSSVNVVSQAQINTDTINALQTTQSTIRTTLIIAVVVAALVIVFAVFLIVRERTREIGLLRAIGASRLQIVGQFAVETLTLGVAAAVAATALIALFAGTVARQFTSAAVGAGRTGGRVFVRGAASGFTPRGGGFGGFGARLGSGAAQTLSAGLTPTSVLLVFALGVGLAILASVIPVWYVSRVRPAEALRAAN